MGKQGKPMTPLWFTITAYAMYIFPAALVIYCIYELYKAWKHRGDKNEGGDRWRDREPKPWPWSPKGGGGWKPEYDLELQNMLDAVGKTVVLPKDVPKESNLVC
jgi:hypothetical protein